ncbi:MULTISPECIES: hypothetical protein [Cysteiniphilum]|uniref:hypothetical protein n=1 Tax=Cysteiniphilum TaxID=2056696 RepID=UPI00178338E3|nr:MULTISPECIES: hypothetical protein [Cysteiniphilum]
MNNMNESLTVILQHLLNNLRVLVLPQKGDQFSLLFMLSSVIGFILLCVFINRLRMHCKPHHMMRHYSPWGTVMYLFSGSFLLSLEAIIQLLVKSFFNNNWQPDSIFNYQPITINNDPLWVSISQLFFACMVVIGVVAILRGFVLAVKLGEGQDGSVGRVLTHIIAGVVAVNAINVVSLINLF